MLENSRIARILTVAASFVIVVAGMRLASPILVPFLLAVFIAIIATPFFIVLQRKGIPTSIALIIIVIVIFVLGIFGLGAIGQSMAELTKNMSTHQQSLQTVLDNTTEWLSSRGIEAPEKVVDDALNPKNIMKVIGGILGGFKSMFGNAFIIFLIVIFLLLEVALLPSKVKNLPGMAENTWSQLEKMVDNVRSYMGIKTIMSLITGAAVAVFTAALGVDYPILLGLLAFLLNYVPNIGSIIAAIPGVLLALIQFGFGRMMIVLAGYVVINVVVSSVIEPRFMGRKLGLSPVIIIASLIFWGWVLGPVGMLLSVPLTMAVKIALESSEETNWLAVLMG